MIKCYYCALAQVQISARFLGVNDVGQHCSALVSVYFFYVFAVILSSVFAITAGGKLKFGNVLLLVPFLGRCHVQYVWYSNLHMLFWCLYLLCCRIRSVVLGV